jgi:cellulose synthase/poly-beta-1,6-N-acetylglucosamine synthase-like glycosyltransferase
MSSQAPFQPVRKRQFGAERSTTPLPTVHEKPSDAQVATSRIAIVLTVGFWAFYVIATVVRQFLDNGVSFRFAMEAVLYLAVVSSLTFSALMYLVARHGALVRFRNHVRVPRAELDRHFGSSSSMITVLVPSYSEEPTVVRQTLWSAALQEYPSMRIVLLVDDPPTPSDPDVAAKLEETRNLAQRIMDDLAEPRSRFSDAILTYELTSIDHDAPSIDDVRTLSAQYAWAAHWLLTMADAEPLDDHVDEFFVSQVLGGLASELTITADALSAAADAGQTPSQDRMFELYRRLAWTFNAELATFERKKYASLSHDANKAMNLNAYIGLMGGAFMEERSPAGTVLRSSTNRQEADLVVPDSTFLLTLDADSILLREYCLRLVYLLEQPENARVAVTQTPYSSFRGAGTRIERLAGATTDIQHLIHQGMSHYGAAFWVGANAVIRKSALEDIVERETIGGFEIKRYVQDRTVIEDTESSIDLGTHGWSIINYPERLSYSATPPDFGSLIVQRRRWANGGLLILPKLWRSIRDRRARGERVGIVEAALRVNYMASIAWSTIGLVFLLVYPYDSRLLSIVVLLAALPYFISMGIDLRKTGYRFSDIFRVYGFNLVLLPVNLAGLVKSVEQAITMKKIPFSRTPKIKDRTAAPILYILAPAAIVVFSVVILVNAVLAQNWGNTTFPAINATLGFAAIVSNVGIRNSIADVWHGATSWLWVDARPTQQPAPATDLAEIDWEAVLYNGSLDGSTPREQRAASSAQSASSRAVSSRRA